MNVGSCSHEDLIKTGNLWSFYLTILKLLDWILLNMMLEVLVG
jgi:hypothetical protein